MMGAGWRAVIPVSVGAVLGVLAFVPALLALASARSRETMPSMLKGFLALGVSFIVLMASTVCAFMALDRDAIFFVCGLVGGFLASAGAVAAKVACEK